MKYSDLVARANEAEALWIKAMEDGTHSHILKMRKIEMDNTTKARVDYECRVQALRKEFREFCENYDKADMCAALEDAQGVFQDGFTESDVEYWYVAQNSAHSRVFGE